MVVNNSFFSLFEKVMNEGSIICVEVPNNSVKRWFKSGERHYDSPHTLFFSKHSLEKIFTERKYKLVFSDYNGMSIEENLKYMEIEKKEFENWYPSKIYFWKEIKKIIKFFVPSIILKIKQKLSEDKSQESSYFKYGDENSWVLRILIKK